LSGCAFIWRRLLFRTVFVAVTGSLGKTTAKELTGAVLESRGRVLRTRHNQNDGFGVPRTILRVRPWHRYAVVEVGIGGPGQMRRLARLVRPDIAVILGVGATHTQGFPSLDVHAAEKGILLDYVARDGFRIVNGDDPRVAPLLDRQPGVHLRFGIGSGCDVRAEDLSGDWPERLRFRVRVGNESREVRTRLVGLHWYPSVLAALSVGQVLQVPLSDSIEAIAGVPPFTGRLSPMRIPGGAIVLRDDYHASATALSVGLEVLSRARAARRRILVISDYSDSGLHRRKRLSELAERAFGAVDMVMVVGSDAGYGKRKLLDRGFPPEAVLAAESMQEAVALLASEIGEGDLVLLKGRTTDHMARVYHALLGTIRCRRSQCGKTVLCDFCPDLGISPRDAARGVLVEPGEALGSDGSDRSG